MAVTMRSIVLAVVPTLTLIIGGLFWFQRRKKPNNQLEPAKPPDKAVNENKANGDIAYVKSSISPEINRQFEAGDAAVSNQSSDVSSSPTQDLPVSIEEVICSKSVTLASALPCLAGDSVATDSDADQMAVEECVLASVEALIQASPQPDLNEVNTETDIGPSVVASDSTITDVDGADVRDLDSVEVTEDSAKVTDGASDKVVDVDSGKVTDVEPAEVDDIDRFPDMSDLSEKVLDWAQDASDSFPEDGETISETISCYSSSPLALSKPAPVTPVKEKGRVTNSTVLPTPSESPQSVSSDSTDAQSEMSNDSGKASSINEMPLSSVTAIQEESESDTASHIKGYEFDFPSDLVGMLIGRQGRGINHVKQHSGVEVTIKNKLYTADTQLISLMGTSKQIEKALSVVKNKFPKSRFKQYNLDFSEALPESPVLPPEVMQLSLPEGVLVDVTVSSVVAGNHIFVQQPTHPSYTSLETLTQCMAECYLDASLVPELPRPIEVGVICAAPMYDSWFRAQVVETYTETDECDVKFVDYGGYLRVPGSMLKQIRSDFTSLPFQTIECYLANVMPCNGAEEFDVEASAGLEELVRGLMLQAEVVSRDEISGIPYINLYTTQENKSWLLNRCLVENGLAGWAEDQ